MAKTISITIPNDLHERLLNIKKTSKSFNISKACQKGIDAAIKKEKRKRREESLNRESLFIDNVWNIHSLIKNMESEYHEVKKELEEVGMEMEPEMKRLFEDD